MKILIKITKDVLRRSANCEALDINKNCAVAIAVRDLFPCATVGIEGINSLPEQIKLPMGARQYIARFDMRTPVERMQMEEFSFEVEVPNRVIDSIGIGECYRVLSESRTLELVHP